MIECFCLWQELYLPSTPRIRNEQPASPFLLKCSRRFSGSFHHARDDEVEMLTHLNISYVEEINRSVIVTAHIKIP